MGTRCRVYSCSDLTWLQLIPASEVHNCLKVRFQVNCGELIHCTCHCGSEFPSSSLITQPLALCLGFGPTSACRAPSGIWSLPRQEDDYLLLPWQDETFPWTLQMCGISHIRVPSQQSTLVISLGSLRLGTQPSSVAVAVFPNTANKCFQLGSAGQQTALWWILFCLLSIYLCIPLWGSKTSPIPAYEEVSKYVETFHPS